MSAEGSNSPSGDAAIDTSVADELDVAESGFFAAYDRLPHSLKLGVVLVAILIIAVVLGIWHTFYFHWFEVHAGVVNESGPYYGFWSGFGSDLGEATLVAGGVAVWRHHNCHVRGCARLGRQVPGTPYLACPKHHPLHEGTKRAVSLNTILHAHNEAQSPSGSTPPTN